MNRQLYLHHYLPALYFSILLLVSRMDRTWQRWSKKVRYTAGLLFIAAIVLSWQSLSPLAYGTDFSSRSKCEKVRSLGGWEFVCQRQNLAWARPQSAKIVVEKRSDHEQHEAQEEAENSQFYYRDPALEDQEGDGHESPMEGDDDHDHEHEGDGDEGEDEVDHAGPFNMDESAHYEHEHFHHPHGNGHGHGHGHSHGHQYHNADREKKAHHHDLNEHDKPAPVPVPVPPPAPAQPASPPPPAPEQQLIPKASPTDTAEVVTETLPEPPALPAEFKEEHRSKADKMMTAAAMRAVEVQEKNALVQEKEALEVKQRELEEKLEARMLEIERQRRESEKQVAEQSRLARERDEIQQQYQQQQQQQQQKAGADVEAEKEKEGQRILHEVIEKHEEAVRNGAGDATAQEAIRSREALEQQVRQLQAQLESQGQHGQHRQQEL